MCFFFSSNFSPDGVEGSLCPVLLFLLFLPLAVRDAGGERIEDGACLGKRDDHASVAGLRVREEKCPGLEEGQKKQTPATRAGETVGGRSNQSSPASVTCHVLSSQLSDTPSSGEVSATGRPSAAGLWLAGCVVSVTLSTEPTGASCVAHGAS